MSHRSTHSLTHLHRLVNTVLAFCKVELGMEENWRLGDAAPLGTVYLDFDKIEDGDDYVSVEGYVMDGSRRPRRFLATIDAADLDSCVWLD